MPELVMVVALLVVGSAVGVALRQRLRRLDHRLPDETDRPAPRSGWVIPTTALLTALAWWATAPGFGLPAGLEVIVPIVYVLAVWTMVPLAFIDLDVHRLPDRIQLPAYPILAALLTLCSLATGDWGALIRALVAGITLFVLFVVLALLPGGGIGFGDVKLAGLLGMLLGWLSWAQVFISVMATFLIGGVVAALLLATRTKGRRDEFAYGPSMLLGAVVALVYPALLRAIM
ncbi:prepilin peptidase [Kribbia dieselivorans]|uniref:prepilin peptidase n=1 Tax=Kribbia dieselivorans TaxID=331526 RepID=UPI000838327D|nr:A24 family peptidase [Kribbia dieselivorans]